MVVENPFLTDFHSFEPDVQRHKVGISVSFPKFDGFQCITRMIEVHHEFFVRRFPLQRIG